MCGCAGEVEEGGLEGVLFWGLRGWRGRRRWGEKAWCWLVGWLVMAAGAGEGFCEGLDGVVGGGVVAVEKGKLAWLRRHLCGCILATRKLGC